MNERIKELLNQATTDALYETKDAIDFLDNPVSKQQRELQLEKFAELIVRECLNVMSKTSEEANKRFTYMGDDVPTVVHQMNIEKHFGVEQ